MSSESKKLPWVHNKHNWTPTNLVIFFLTKQRHRDVSRFEVLTLVIMEISVFLCVTPCSLAGIYQHCEENNCFNLLTWYLRKVSQFLALYDSTFLTRLPIIYFCFLSAQWHKSSSDKHSDNCHFASGGDDKACATLDRVVCIRDILWIWFFSLW